jgi:hypothetical protein
LIEMRTGGDGTLTDASLRRWWPLAAVAALLALAALAAAHSSLRISRAEPPVRGVPPAMPEHEAPNGRPSFPPTPREVAPAEQSEIPGWLTTAAIGVCLAVTVVAIAVPLWRLLCALGRRRSGRMPAAPTGPDALRTDEEVVAALDAGLVDLSDTDADPRRAVIACWVRLEQAAAAAGLPRQVGDTPTDLVTRLLGARTAVSADVLAAFADVYREARYATHTVEERTREQARAALRRLRGELTGEAVRP